MDDLRDLVLAMLGVAVAAVLLVAGELYLVTRPDPPEKNSEPPAVVTSSAEQQPRQTKAERVRGSAVGAYAPRER